mmetsp:Transcript_63700/g.139636  ORF Transcript_63700/g.139636 Transcript_63700/m.139636 type:complete len:218 (-) Transcript_63700:606-1259(-)
MLTRTRAGLATWASNFASLDGSSSSCVRMRFAGGSKSSGAIASAGSAITASVTLGASAVGVAAAAACFSASAFASAAAFSAASFSAFSAAAFSAAAFSIAAFSTAALAASTRQFKAAEASSRFFALFSSVSIFAVNPSSSLECFATCCLHVFISDLEPLMATSTCLYCSSAAVAFCRQMSMSASRPSTSARTSLSAGARSANFSSTCFSFAMSSSVM